MTPNDILTDHFHLSELVASQTAARRGIDNTPTAVIVANLTQVARLLEKVRVLLGSRPITISSGYRSPRLNAAVCGVRNSAHLYGLAADFICPSFGAPLEICRAIEKSNIVFDQVIQEGTWVHIALASPGAQNRRQLLTANFAAGGTTYSEGV